MKLLILFFLISLNLASASPSVKIPNWGILTELFKPGTRSQVTGTFLVYNLKKLPKELQHVVTPLGEFKAKQVAPWINEVGWKSTESKKSTFSNSDKPKIEHEDLDEDWIAAKFEDYSSNTWFYSEEFGYWINPSKVDEFIESMLKNKRK